MHSILACCLSIPRYQNKNLEITTLMNQGFDSNLTVWVYHGQAQNQTGRVVYFLMMFFHYFVNLLFYNLLFLGSGVGWATKSSAYPQSYFPFISTGIASFRSENWIQLYGLGQASPVCFI